jgi:hypothetical protein
MASPAARLPGAGTTAQARTEISNAAKALIRALAALGGVQSDEAQAVLGALNQLKKVVGEVDEGIGQSEIKSLLAGAEAARPGPGAMGPMSPAAPRPFAAAGMPFNPSGGAPGGAPSMGMGGGL